MQMNGRNSSITVHLYMTSPETVFWNNICKLCILLFLSAPTKLSDCFSVWMKSFSVHTVYIVIHSSQSKQAALPKRIVKRIETQRWPGGVFFFCVFVCLFVHAIVLQAHKMFVAWRRLIQPLWHGIAMKWCEEVVEWANENT